MLDITYENIPNPQTAEEALRASAKNVAKITAKYTRNHHHLREEIQAEAIYGVMCAWEKFSQSPEEKKTASFATYSYYWVWATVKAFTQKQWKDIELTREYLMEKHQMPCDSFEQDVKDWELAKQADAISGEFRAIFDARMAGYTFSEVANEMGYKNQFTCRNIYMDGVAQLETNDF